MASSRKLALCLVVVSLACGLASSRPLPNNNDAILPRGFEEMTNDLEDFGESADLDSTEVSSSLALTLSDHEDFPHDFGVRSPKFGLGLRRHQGPAVDVSPHDIDFYLMKSESEVRDLVSEARFISGFAGSSPHTGTATLASLFTGSSSATEWSAILRGVSRRLVRSILALGASLDQSPFSLGCHRIAALVREATNSAKLRILS